MSAGSSSVRRLVDQFDQSDKPLSEMEIVDAIRALPLHAPLTEDDRAEYLAFAFIGQEKASVSSGATYFRPCFQGTDQDGKQFEWPDVAEITPIMIEYWSGRSQTAIHPVLKARYADLVWDLQRAVMNSQPAIIYAHAAIDAYLDTVRQEKYRYASYALVLLERSLDLTLRINDPARIISVRDVILWYEAKAAILDKPGTWGVAYDLLMNQKKIPLNDAHRDEIVSLLEQKLKVLGEPSDPTNFAPYAAEAAALRLADHYRKTENQDELKRVLAQNAQAWLAAIPSASALQAYAWVNRLRDLYQQFGLAGEAKVLDPMLRSLGLKTENEMHDMEVEVRFPRGELDQFLASLLEGDLHSVLTRIAWEFVPSKVHMEKQVLEIATDAPLYALVRRSVVDHEGRIVATVGSVRDDLEGRVVLQTADYLRYTAPILSLALLHFHERFSPSVDDLLEIICQAPIFQEDRREIMRRALTHLAVQQYIEAIHLFTPQIEAAIRQVLVLTHGTLYSQKRPGMLALRTLDDVLRDTLIETVLGEDTTIYLRVLLTDQRGWNIRNVIAHGLAPQSQMGAVIAHRLFHAVLVLGQIRFGEAEETTIDPDCGDDGSENP